VTAEAVLALPQAALHFHLKIHCANRIEQVAGAGVGELKHLYRRCQLLVDQVELRSSIAVLVRVLVHQQEPILRYLETEEKIRSEFYGDEHQVTDEVEWSVQQAASHLHL